MPSPPSSLEFEEFRDRVDEEVRLKTAPNSVDPRDIGDLLRELSLLVERVGGGDPTTTPTQLSTPALSLVVDGETAITASWTNVANEEGYSVQIATNSGFSTGLQTVSKSPDVLTHQFTGLTASTTYYIRVKAVGDGDTYSDSSYDTETATTDAVVVDTVQVFYGVADALGAPTVEVIEASTRHVDVVAGADYYADFTYSSLDKFWWIAEPSSEPVKTNRYASVLDTDTIGDPGGLLSEVTIVGEYRVYHTGYATQNTTNPQQIKKTA